MTLFTFMLFIMALPVILMLTVFTVIGIIWLFAFIFAAIASIFE